MKQNNFYVVDGCTVFIPVKNSTLTPNGVEVTIVGNAQKERVLVDKVYQMPKIDEPQKPVVPKFVADFYESIKDDFEDKVYELCLQYNRGNCELSSELYEWFSWFKNEPIQTLVEMKLYGYEIEQEKLYTVEIPSPNRTTEPIIYLSRDERGKIFLTSWFLLVGQNWKKHPHSHLTEAEIKQDFEWAWDAGFAKEI